MWDQFLSLFEGRRLWVVLALALVVLVDYVPDGELDTAEFVIDALSGLVTEDLAEADDEPATPDVSDPEVEDVDDVPVEEDEVVPEGTDEGTGAAVESAVRIASLETLLTLVR